MKEVNINTNNKNELNENNNSEEQDKTEIKIIDILSQYKNGISSIFNESKLEEENYFLIIFKCPESFRLKYQNLAKQNLNESINLKLYADFSSKQKIKEELINVEENLNIKFGEIINKYIIMLNHIFEKFFGSDIILLEKLVKTYFEIKKNDVFDYEDFILIFCSIIKL
jgi:ribosomal protein L20A (L18A)